MLTRKTPLFWWCAFRIRLIRCLSCSESRSRYLLAKGVGIWGVEIPVAWAFAITNFVWWIGIGHAGTLISAFLLLLNQGWRNSINRFAEAMTIFAVLCAGMFPLLHLGRAWIFYWLLPYPNTMTVQPQFPQPASLGRICGFDVLYRLGLVLVYRDDSRSRLLCGTARRAAFRTVFTACSLSGGADLRTIGSCTRRPACCLPVLATPLVLSVHTVVSFDFTIAILPGWHSTIFPPYFVAGAIYSGFAMVLVLGLPLRKVYGLHNLITVRHLNNCGKLMLVTGLFLAYTYLIEPFTAWYSGNDFEMYTVHNRAVRTACMEFLACHSAECRHSAGFVVL